MVQQHPEESLQAEYYARTAAQYDDWHVHAQDPNTFALAVLGGLLDHLGVKSILDIGSGTGRLVLQMKRARPDLRVVGIEPVAALRQVGYAKGLAETELIAGDATKLQFGDGAFDLVCEFGALHHIREPSRAVAEMLRVARKAIFLSDSNNFGQGSPLARAAKQVLHALRLWRLANWIKTGGKGYTISEGDGLAYSYSVFGNYAQVARACRRVHVFNTSAGGINPYRTAEHVGLLGLK